MAAILGKTKFFENWDSCSAEISCESKISWKSLYLARFSRYKHFSLKSLYLARFSRYKHFCVLQFFRKIQIGMANLQRYPVGQKFRRSGSISHGFRDISIFVFSLFGKISND